MVNEKTIVLISVILFAGLSMAQAQGESADKTMIIERTLNAVESAQAPSMNAMGTSLPPEDMAADSYAVDLAVEPQTEEDGLPQHITLDEVDFNNTPIMDAFDVISRKTGLIFIAAPDVSGRITLKMRNIDVWDALKAILEKNNLAYTYKSRIVNVMTADAFRRENGYSFGGTTQSRIVKIQYAHLPTLVARLLQVQSEEGNVLVDDESKTLILMDIPRTLEKMQAIINEIDSPRATEVFALKYALAQDVKKAVEPLLTKDLGTVETDSSSNKVLITDTYKKILELKKVIAGLDKKITLQLHTQIYRIRLSEEHKDGVDWEAIIGDYQSLDLPPKEDVIVEGSKLSIGTLTDEDFEVLVDALETVGEVNKFSETDVKAVIHQKTDIVINTLDQEDADEEEARQGSFEIAVSITPALKAGGAAELALSPKLLWVKVPSKEDGEQREVLFTPKEDVPVHIESNEVIVIGGMVKEVDIERTSKFPLLGDIPFVGFVFRRQNKFVETTEYVVFMNYTILKEEPEGTSPSSPPVPSAAATP